MPKAASDPVKTDRRTQPPVDDGLSGLATITMFVLMMQCFILGIPWLKALVKVPDRYLAQLFVVALMLGAALLLYRLRTRRRRLYAYMEIAFALVAAWHTLDELSKPGNALFHVAIGIGASIYLMIRGLDNRAQAAKEDAARRVPAEQEFTEPKRT